ncbi:MAG: hypothetical protein ACLGI3_13820 [Actinomycetes bacterium]
MSSADPWCGIMPLAKATSASLWSATALLEEPAEPLLVEVWPVASDSSPEQPASSRVPATRAPAMPDRLAVVRVMVVLLS